MIKLSLNVHSRTTILHIAVYLATLALMSTHLHSQQLLLRLHHRVGNEVLRTDSAVYTNALGQHFSVSRFRYYLSDFRWVGDRAHSATDSLSYLVDQDDSASMCILVSTPTPPSSRVHGIHFIIGVDSAHNCAGLQEGSLDPVQGMFWAWNTGYIFLKLDGRSDQSTETASLIEYHIGGFQWPNNCIRDVELQFNSGLDLRAGDTLVLDADVDVARLFGGAHSINFRTQASITDATNAVMIADNYAHMIRVRAVQVQRPNGKEHEKY